MEKNAAPVKMGKVHAENDFKEEQSLDVQTRNVSQIPTEEQQKTLADAKTAAKVQAIKDLEFLIPQNNIPSKGKMTKLPEAIELTKKKFDDHNFINTYTWKMLQSLHNKLYRKMILRIWALPNL